MSRQSEHTKTDIMEAFNRLVVQYRFDDISVAMICREAGVGKTTFYRYYKDKYDVMNYNYTSLLERCIAMEEVKTYEDLYVQLYAAAHKSFWTSIKKVFGSTGYNSFHRYIAEHSYETAEAITKRNRNGRGFTEGEKLQCDVFVWGISNMYEKWTFGQYDLNAEEAGHLLFVMMPETLRYYPVKEQQRNGVQETSTV